MLYTLAFSFVCRFGHSQSLFYKHSFCALNFFINYCDLRVLVLLNRQPFLRKSQTKEKKHSPVHLISSPNSQTTIFTMASQQTPQMAQNNSLPQEMIEAGFQPYYQPYPGQQQTIAPPPIETSKRAEFTRLGFFATALLLGIIGLGLSLSSLSGSDISVAIAALPAVCFFL